MATADYLGEFEALVLAAVLHAGDEANGARVYKELEARAHRDVSLPAIHVTLRRLEEKALLASSVGATSDKGGRPRRYYAVTTRGLDALREFRDTWRNVWRGLRIPDQGAGR